MAFNVTDKQIVDLARPFVNTINIREFYADPKNETAYRKWHIEKYIAY